MGRRDLHAACKGGFATGPLLALRHSLTDVPWSGAALMEQANSTGTTAMTAMSRPAKGAAPLNASSRSCSFGSHPLQVRMRRQLWCSIG